MLWPQINSYQEFDDEKKFLRARKFPSLPPPHNFSNGPSLRLDFSRISQKKRLQRSPEIRRKGKHLLEKTLATKVFENKSL